MDSNCFSRAESPRARADRRMEQTSAVPALIQIEKKGVSDHQFEAGEITLQNVIDDLGKTASATWRNQEAARFGGAGSRILIAGIVKTALAYYELTKSAMWISGSMRLSELVSVMPAPGKDCIITYLHG